LRPESNGVRLSFGGFPFFGCSSRFFGSGFFGGRDSEQAFGLVERIEQGITADNAFDDILIRHLGAYEGLTVDGIVLGCTHFPFISGAIARYASMHFKGEHRLYDGNAGTARQLGRVLRREGLAAPKGAAEGLDTNSRVTFCTSADKPSAEPIFRMLLSLPEWGK